MKTISNEDSLAQIWNLWPDALKYEVETPFDAKLPDRKRSAPWRLTFREKVKPSKRQA